MAISSYSFPSTTPYETEATDFIHSLTQPNPEVVSQIEHIFSLAVFDPQTAQDCILRGHINTVFAEKLPLDQIERIKQIITKIIRFDEESTIVAEIAQWKKTFSTFEQAVTPSTIQTALFSWPTLFNLIRTRPVQEEQSPILNCFTMGEELLYLRQIFSLTPIMFGEKLHDHLMLIQKNIPPKLQSNYKTLDALAIHPEWLYYFLKTAYNCIVISHLIAYTDIPKESISAESIQRIYQNISKNFEIVKYFSLLKEMSHLVGSFSKNSTNTIRTSFLEDLSTWFTTIQKNPITLFHTSKEFLCQEVVSPFIHRISPLIGFGVYRIDWGGNIAFLSPQYPLKNPENGISRATLTLDLNENRYYKIRNVSICPIFYSDLTQPLKDGSWLYLGTQFPGSLKISLLDIIQDNISYPQWAQGTRKELAQIQKTVHSFIYNVCTETPKLTKIADHTDTEDSYSKIAVRKNHFGNFCVVLRNFIAKGTDKVIYKEKIIWSTGSIPIDKIEIARAKIFLRRNFSQEVASKIDPSSSLAPPIPKKDATTYLFSRELAKKNEDLAKEALRSQLLIKSGVPNIVGMDVLTSAHFLKTRSQMPFYPLSSLGRALETNPQMHERANRADHIGYLYDMAQSVSKMHLLGFVHNDLKLENFMYNDRTKKVLLSDFGTLRPYGVFGLRNLFDKTGNPGTYPAPEYISDIQVIRSEKSVQDKDYSFFHQVTSPANDTWAFGLCMYALLYGKEALTFVHKQMSWESSRDMLLKGLEKILSQLSMTETLDILIRSLLSIDPSQRPHMAIVLDQLYELLPQKTS